MILHQEIKAATKPKHNYNNNVTILYNDIYNIISIYHLRMTM